MYRKRRKLALLLLSGAILCGAAGSCLPENFFATLAGDVLADVVNQIVSATVGGVLGNAVNYPASFPDVFVDKRRPF
jgi:hypothetical protein